MQRYAIYEPTTIAGTVQVLNWNEADDTMTIRIITAGAVYTVVPTKKGNELFYLENEKVEVTGAVTESDQGLMIDVSTYDVPDTESATDYKYLLDDNSE